ncbi:MAG TPA: hypothetical protein PKA28_14135 [Methylomusa anaerophila]|uniref:Uncharacterized protein n=1 Tax=Methylomusa anaerophila TaxID=1930071 RepID=A0A348AEZ8_9FIRM|nr:hypothetical protein [Methylomusa anaerophila]BBB89646.1 hypothetical protein MAMMFC1_00279 [Methylomusa anaerophila]HML89578.1 hypothetical protein [Methylomusa anaerophila]
MHSNHPADYQKAIEFHGHCSRARLTKGKIACLACTEEYTRGW